MGEFDYEIRQLRRVRDMGAEREEFTFKVEGKLATKWLNLPHGALHALIEWFELRNND